MKPQPNPSRIRPTTARIVRGICLVAALLSPEIFADPLIGGGQISRQVQGDEALRTLSIQNGVGKSQCTIEGGDEFAITLARNGGDAIRLTAKDFEVAGSSAADGGMQYKLRSDTAPVDVTVRYWKNPNEPWMRKQLAVTAKEAVTIEKVEVEHLAVTDAYQPYRADALTVRERANWKPPLGQPVYVKKLAAWFGLEFPAARNEVKDGHLVCGYLTDVPLKTGDSYTSHNAVMGVADDDTFLKDAFFDYIDATRVRPLRLQTQYNCWFDYGKKVDQKQFVASVEKVNQELMTERGVPPLSAYVIDDGWQDTAKDWSKTGVWPANNKFDADFSSSREAVAKAHSELGLWLSPGCLFGGTPAIRAMKAAGWRSLSPWMSMTGESYMAALEKRMVELATNNVEYFKLDGIFGHLNQRNFDVKGLKGTDTKLDSPEFQDAKERYISLGSERLMKIFRQMAEVNPDVYIVISNGAYLSPWWLQHIDAVWMINAGDAARGADRTGELVYRDKVYYRLASPDFDNTQFPLHSIFNHEPKKTESGEDPDVFRRYLYMNLSRGTGFVELYLKTFELSESDWDVLAEGMKWVHKVFPNFKHARMIGGDPGKNRVYGYTGWTDSTGYVSLHNPSDKPAKFRVTLDRALGIPKETVATGSAFSVSSPLEGDVKGLSANYKVGETIVVTMPPKAIRVIEFTRLPK